VASAKKSLTWLRRILPVLTVVLLVAVVYDGFIFYSRWRHRQDSEEAIARMESEDARKTLDMLGGDGLRINSFYATPGVVRAGSPATLCYGVNGATKVRIEPAVEEIKPSLSRCLQVTPPSDTEYKLIAEDASGQSVSRSFVLKVTP
jgi:hypothetical protein